MRNDEIASALYMIAELLELSGDEDRFRPISYRRAARAIESEAEDVGALAREGRLTQIPGVGKGIAAKIEEFLRAGKIGELEALRAQFPPGLLEIMRIPDIGPKTARRLHLELGVKSLEDLRTVALQGRLRALKGFGEKSEQNVLKGIGLVESAKGQNLLGIVLPIAEQIVEHVRTHASVDHVAYGGSVRRMKESVGDCDILVTTTDPAAATKAFLSFPMVREVVMSGDTKSTVVVSIGGERLQVDLRVLEPRSWGSGLQYFTGSKDHNIKVRTMAAKVGLKLNEYGVFRGDERATGSTEEEVYATLGLPYIEAELREDAGEIEAALSGALPDLVTMGDIRGDLHAHTNLTDGVNTVEEMAAAAAARGYEYLGISDHSPSLRVANGLSEEHLRIHVAHIREFNRQTAGIRLLAGTECDILADGTLDYPDPVLKDLDYVIGSVHSNFKMPEKEMMARVLRAMENEHMDILAHPTTRKIGQREPIQLNMERLAKAAADTGTVLEINGYPDRMDLSGPQARLAREHGAKLIVNTDSHTTEQLWFMRLAVGSARRGWLGKEDVVNTMPHKEILRFLA
ncbi:MAG TPA: DNA polymerase/3'-5' exonuclease PolX [Thermoplasmata archaeon]|nr:DNA polymerase/3'-5' exonuclease PolX [Thermoplasmata archaeon]